MLSTPYRSTGDPGTHNAQWKLFLSVGMNSATRHRTSCTCAHMRTHVPASRPPDAPCACAVSRCRPSCAMSPCVRVTVSKISSVEITRRIPGTGFISDCGGHPRRRYIYVDSVINNRIRAGWKLNKAVTLRRACPARGGGTYCARAQCLYMCIRPPCYLQLGTTIYLPHVHARREMSARAERARRFSTHLELAR